MTTTLGIDLATKNGTTGICEIRWTAEGATIVDLPPPKKGSKLCADEPIVERIKTVRRHGGWVAIDAPFGFPVHFTEAVAACDSGDPDYKPPAEDDDTNPLIRRATDCYVHEVLLPLHATAEEKQWVTWPLSSVVERITPTVLRCDRILRSLGLPIDRIGTDSHIVETYPAAALRVWNVVIEGYKQNPEKVVAHVRKECPWLDVDNPDYWHTLNTSDDALDALVCAFVARLAQARRTGPDETDGDPKYELYRREGWIHLPSSHDTLCNLVHCATDPVKP